MGGSKSKPKDESKRTRSLDANLGSGGGAGSHHLNSNQSLTPNRSPTMDGGLIGNPSAGNKAELTLFGGVECNNVTSSNMVTLAGESSSFVLVVGHCVSCLNCMSCMYDLVSKESRSYICMCCVTHFGECIVIFFSFVMHIQQVVACRLIG